MTAIILGVLLLAVLSAWLYRERENAKERSALSDRIQAPGAVQMAALEQAIADVPPIPPPVVDRFDAPVPEQSDLALATLLGED